MATRSTRTVASVRARKRRRSRLAGSAQWRSSSRSSDRALCRDGGEEIEHLLEERRLAGALRRRCRAGRTRRAVAARRRALVAARRVRPTGRRAASRSGRSSARRARAPPAPLASRQIVSASAVLPIPASPPISTRLPCPARAAVEMLAQDTEFALASHQCGRGIRRCGGAHGVPRVVLGARRMHSGQGAAVAK